MKAYLGVDWSATEVECALGVGEVDPPRPIKGTKRTLDGVRELLERVRARAPGVNEVHVVIEAGAPGWVMMFHHAGAIVHVVDPKQAKKFAESLCSSGAKDDARDAAYQVALGRSARHLPPAWAPADPWREQLCELGAMHETWTQELVAAQQRLRALLRERLPALEQALPVLTRGWVLRVIRAVPTALHAERVAEAQLQAVFKGSGARETTRTAVAEAVRACSAPWLTAAVARVQEIHVLQLVAQIELLSEQVANVEKELDALTRDMDIRAHLESVAGVGTKIPLDADPACPPQRGSISAAWASVARASRRRAVQEANRGDDRRGAGVLDHQPRRTWRPQRAVAKHPVSFESGAARGPTWDVTTRFCPPLQKSSPSTLTGFGLAETRRSRTPSRHAPSRP